MRVDATDGRQIAHALVDALEARQRLVDRDRGRFACCDVVNRGMAMWNGKVYVGTIDGRLVALDAATGEIVWDTLTVDLERPYTITGAPRERNILDEVIASTDVPMIDLPKMGMDLGTLKSVVKHATLMVSNDTGPRHIAAAFGVPVVTVFGPTDPRWTEIDFEHERIVRVDVFCGPCQKRTCPLDHRCMTQVTPEMVFEQVQELLSSESKQETSA